MRHLPHTCPPPQTQLPHKPCALHLSFDHSLSLSLPPSTLTLPHTLLPGVLGQQQPVLNFCANNYLGLSNHPQVVSAAKQALDTHGFGLSSVRFICGTQVGTHTRGPGVWR